MRNEHSRFCLKINCIYTEITVALPDPTQITGMDPAVYPIWTIGYVGPTSIDIDGNGTLDFAEFSAFFAAISSGAEDANDDNFNEA